MDGRRILVLSALAAVAAVGVLVYDPTPDAVQLAEAGPAAAPLTAEPDGEPSAEFSSPARPLRAEAVSPERAAQRVEVMGPVAPAEAVEPQLLKLRLVAKGRVPAEGRRVDLPLERGVVEVRAWELGVSKPEDVPVREVGAGEFALAIEQRFDRFECRANAPGRREQVYIGRPTSEPDVEIEVTLKLEPGGEARFEVVDRFGERVTDAEVDLTVLDGATPWEAQAWQAGGAGGVLGVGGDRVALAVSSPTAGRRTVEFDLPLEGEPIDLGPIQLGGPEVLRGRLFLEGGAPLAGVMVMARSTGGGSGGYQDGVAVTDDDGRFELDNLAPARFELELAPTLDPFATTYRQAHTGGAEFEWASPAALVEVAAELEGAAVRISGGIAIARGSETVEVASGVYRDDRRRLERVLLLRGEAYRLSATTELSNSLWDHAVERVLSAELEADPGPVRAVTLRPEEEIIGASLVLVGFEPSYHAFDVELVLTGAGGTTVVRQGRLRSGEPAVAFEGLPIGDWTWSAGLVRDDGARSLAFSVRTAAGVADLAETARVQLIEGHRSLVAILKLESAAIPIDLSALDRNERGAIDVESVDDSGIEFTTEFDALVRADAVMTRSVLRSANLGEAGFIPPGARGLGPFDPVGWRTTIPVPIGRYRVTVRVDGRDAWEEIVDLSQLDDWLVRPWAP